MVSVSSGLLGEEGCVTIEVCDTKIRIVQNGGSDKVEQRVRRYGLWG